MKKGNQFKKFPKGVQFKKCAVILKNDQIVKIYDYPAQCRILNADPTIIVYEDCDEDQLEEKAAYWDRIVNYDPEKVRLQEEEFLKRQNLKEDFIKLK